MAIRDSDHLGWKVLGWILDALVGVLILAAAAGTRTMITMDKALQEQQTTQTHIIETLGKVQEQLELQGKKQVEFEVWRASTDANRFTVDDSKELVSQDLELWKSIAEVKEHVASISMQGPVEWFQNDFSELKVEVRELKETVRQLELQN